MKLDWLFFGFPRRPRDPDAPVYGEVLERAVAAAIDLGILYLLLADFFYWMSGRLLRHVDQSLFHQAWQQEDSGQFLQLLLASGMPQVWAITAVCQVAILGVFVVLMQIVWNTTPGKWLLGLRIVRRGSFAPVAPWRYVLRFLAYIPACAPLMLGMVWANFNREHRGWHDMIAGTVVLSSRPRGWYWKKTKQCGRWLWKKISARTPRP